jgi:large subunit ribosomal protein L4
MPTVALMNTKGEKVGELALSDEIFGVAVRPDVMHQVVKMQLANRRQGTHSTKTRAEVSGGGKKPWRQKGTGRARVGSSRNPVWTKGGIAFGPKPRDYRYTLPRKIKRLALKSALSSKVVENQILVLEDLTLNQIRTKDMVQILKNLKVENKALIVTGKEDQNLKLSARNIPGIKTMMPNTLNVFDLLYHDTLLLTKDAVQLIEEVYA